MRAMWVLAAVGVGCSGNVETERHATSPDEASAMSACVAMAGDAHDCINDPGCQGQQAVVYLPSPGFETWLWVYGGSLAGSLVHIGPNFSAAYACGSHVAVSECAALSQAGCARSACTWNGTACVFTLTPELAPNVIGTW